jgi:hypothetical protein
MGIALQTSSPDYAEILRLHRKYRLQDDEPLWMVFVRVGQELERSAKKDRCPSCFYTDLGYSRLVEQRCTDPWHGDNHLRANTPQHLPHDQHSME